VGLPTNLIARSPSRKTSAERPGLRERSSPEVHAVVIANPAPFVPRNCGTLTELEAKEVKLQA
jgi:hypothetical protein